ncbi:MAG: gliding motility-associated ABC transporter ATP-binding subunit GldA [Bacteroidia bacterium]|nr:MAG: gliding motility-associated ABC transporter ATP-binding subunit GldA [Bacteroidia bacterium]
MSVTAANITKVYGEQKALDDVSFNISDGEVVALLGPNGAGKSTMMKIIACFLPPSGGTVTVCGYHTSTHPLQVKKRVGYLPENNPLYTDMYVKEYLQFAAGVYKLGRQTRSRVEEMIELTGLTGEYRKTIGKLSKGYRQRVGLAQALIHDPEVLILDEPTSGLDPNQLMEIRQLIREIGKKKTVILSTHIMQEVEAVCNRVMIISRGKIMADAPTGEIRLLNKARHIVRVEFDRPADILKLKSIRGVIDVVNEQGCLYRVYAETNTDLRPEIFRFAVSNGMVILSLAQQEEKLEEIFRQMTS